MDASLISGLSAVLGSLVGGSASIATAWFTQRAQGRRERVTEEIRKRELLYTEFITECSKLSIDSIDKSLDSPAVMVQVYALQNRIRLTGSDAVVAATEVTIKGIVDQYFLPNLTMLEIREMNLKNERPQVDPLKSFSEACRQELQDLQNGIAWSSTDAQARSSDDRRANHAAQPYAVDGEDHDACAPAYRLGGQERGWYANKSFDVDEPSLARDDEGLCGDGHVTRDLVKHAARAAWDRVTNQG